MHLVSYKLNRQFQLKFRPTYLIYTIFWRKTHFRICCSRIFCNIDDDTCSAQRHVQTSCHFWLIAFAEGSEVVSWFLPLLAFRHQLLSSIRIINSYVIRTHSSLRFIVNRDLVDGFEPWILWTDSRYPTIHQRCCSR